MSGVKWIKLSVGMPNNRKIKRIRRLPDGDNIILIWIFLLLKAGESNKQGGLFFLEDMPYTIEDLADEFEFSTDLISFALKTLEKLEMIEMYDEVIYIKNWDKYQSVDQLQRIRQQTRERVARHRARKALDQGKTECNVTVTGDVTQGNATDIDIEEDIDKELKDIYTHWNSKGIIRHREFTKVMQGHVKARLKDRTFDEVIKAIDNYKTVLDGEEYFYKHKFTLTDFMNPKNIDRFLDENEPFKVHLKFERKEQSKPAYQTKASQKPKVEIVTDRTQEVSDEEYQRMLETARRLER